MKNFIRIGSHINVVLDNGETLSSQDCTEEEFEKIRKAETDEEVKEILIKDYAEKKKKVDSFKFYKDAAEKSDIIQLNGDSAYMKDISEITLPPLLFKKILEAEQEGDEVLLETYRNFWTLASTNPDSRARNNMFWFLEKNDMKITRSGLIVAYRNVDLKSEGSMIDAQLSTRISAAYFDAIVEHWGTKDIIGKLKSYAVTYNYRTMLYDIVPPQTVAADHLKVLGNLYDMFHRLSDKKYSPVFTDQRTGTFNISIGKPVTMDRKDCDPNQDNCCSRGLHQASINWLKNYNFGSHALMVLVNPADVVAVPPVDNYGKMRSCAYYPVAHLNTDEDSNIVEIDVKDGQIGDFFDYIVSNTEVNNEDAGKYKLEIPDIPEINRSNIMDKIQEIKDSFSNK